MSRNRYIVVANLIKFGLPLGFLLAIGKICFSGLFLDDVITFFGTVGYAIWSLFLGIAFGMVLGPFRTRNLH